MRLGFVPLESTKRSLTELLHYQSCATNIKSYLSRIIIRQAVTKYMSALCGDEHEHKTGREPKTSFDLRKIPTSQPFAKCSLKFDVSFFKHFEIFDFNSDSVLNI